MRLILMVRPCECHNRCNGPPTYRAQSEHGSVLGFVRKSEAPIGEDPGQRACRKDVSLAIKRLQRELQVLWVWVALKPKGTRARVPCQATGYKSTKILRGAFLLCVPVVSSHTRHLTYSFWTSR